MTDQFVFRKPKKKYEESLLSLVLEFTEFNKKSSGLNEKYYDLFDGDVLKDRKEYTKMIVGKSSGYCIVAEVENRLIGFGFIYYDKNLKESVIDQIFIKENFRSCGIGKTIITKLIEWANDRGGRVRIEVFSWNNDAKTFYESMGFKLESFILTNYYP